MIGGLHTKNIARWSSSVGLHAFGVSVPPLLQEQTAHKNGRLQSNAQQPETFTPSVLSLQPAAYVSMIEKLHLPYKAVETTSCVGPFFWSAFDDDEENPHLRMCPHGPILPSHTYLPSRNCLSEERCS